MNGKRVGLLLVSVGFLVAGTCAGATDQPVPGTALGLKASASGREKLSFRSNGSFAIPTPGSPDDPQHAGASLQLLNPNTSESFTFDLPSSHWSVTSAGTLYKYRDSVLAESGKVKVAIIGGRRLKVSGEKVGITLNESSQGELDVTLSSGSFRYCAVFADGAVRRDSPGVFSAKGAPAPAACPAAAGTTTTTTTTTSTITVTLPTATTVTVPVTTTTVTIPLPPLGMVTFTITPGSATSGGPFIPPPSAPLKGEVDNASGQKIADLGVDCLYAGGAGAGPPTMIPDGSTSVLAVTGISSGVALTLSGSAGSGPADCTLGAGPGKRCLNGNPGTDSMGTCSSDADCGNQTDACAPEPHCFFGQPVPVPSPATPATSTCIVNALATDASGAANLLTRETTLNASLAPEIYLTGDAVSPCPQCVSGTCSAGERMGKPCSGGIGSTNTTVECLPAGNQFVARFAVNLSPLTTGTTTLSGPAGLFCPDQKTPGAFGRVTPRTIIENGSPLLGTASPFATTLAGVSCIPATASQLVNDLVDLPGPAALAVSGMTSVQLF